jgi:hypothetical protein
MNQRNFSEELNKPAAFTLAPWTITWPVDAPDNPDLKSEVTAVVCNNSGDGPVDRRTNAVGKDPGKDETKSP